MSTGRELITVTDTIPDTPPNGVRGAHRKGSPDIIAENPWPRRIVVAFLLLVTAGLVTAYAMAFGQGYQLCAPSTPPAVSWRPGIPPTKVLPPAGGSRPVNSSHTGSAPDPAPPSDALTPVPLAPEPVTLPRNLGVIR